MQMRSVILISVLLNPGFGYSQNSVTQYRLVAERSDYYNYFTGQLTPNDSILYFYSGDQDTLDFFMPINIEGSSDHYDTIRDTFLEYDSALSLLYYPDTENWKLRWKWYSAYTDALINNREHFSCMNDDCTFESNHIYFYDADNRLINYSDYSSSEADTVYKMTYGYLGNLLNNAAGYYRYDEELEPTYTYYYTYNEAGKITSKTVYDYDPLSGENQLYALEEFIYDDAGNLIEYNYNEKHYSEGLKPQFNIYYTYEDNRLTEKVYEDYNIFYDDWSFTEKFVYIYTDGLITTEENYLDFADTAWGIVNTTTYSYDEKDRLIRKEDLYETTEYLYNDANQLLQKINYDDSTFEASESGFKITCTYDEHGNRTYYEWGILDWAYRIQTRSWFYYEPYEKEIAGFPTESIYINVYPNPADDYLNVQIGLLTGDQFITVKLFNTLGQEIYASDQMISNPYFLTIDCHKILHGFYILSVYDGTNVSWQKIYIN